MDPKKPTGTTPPETPPEHNTPPSGDGDDGQPEPSGNKTWNDDPKTFKLKSELSKLRKEKEDAKAANVKAKRDAELKKAVDEERFSDAQAQLEKEKEDLETKHKKELQTRDLQVALMGNKFEDKYFIKSVTDEYNPESHGSIDDYVKGLASDEANKRYMAQDGKQTGPVIPPGKLPAGGSMTGVNAAQIKAMQKSNDPKQRAEARRFLKEYADNNNNQLPEGF
jgi:hypothetical protein